MFQGAPESSENEPAVFTERLITGFQPSKHLHLGHYAGAITPILEHQLLHPNNCFVLIADWHFLTSRPTTNVRDGNIALASALIALGIDPEACTLYQQSDVQQTAELMWILSCYVGAGVLDRSHAMKAAKKAGQAPSVGLYLYPLLQVADILGVRATRVPAGNDQRQHVELARDLSRRINAAAGHTVFPEPQLEDRDLPMLIGTDGKRKMSNIHRNIIAIFDDSLEIEAQVNSIASPAVRAGTPLDPDAVAGFQLLSQMLPASDEIEEIREELRAGRMRMDTLKRRIVLAHAEYFGSERDRYRALMADQDYVRDVLAAGAERVRRETAETVMHAREAVGF